MKRLTDSIKKILLCRKSALKISAAALFLAFIAFSIISCRFSDSGGTESSEEFQVSMNLSIPDGLKLSSSDTDRTAVSETPSVICKVTAVSSLETVTLYTNKTTFNLLLKYASWTISVAGYKGTSEADCTDTNQILSADSKTITPMNQTLTFSLYGVSGNGTVNLPVKVYDNTSILECVCTWGDSSSCTLDFSSSDTQYFHLTSDNSQSPVAAGYYDVTFEFSDGLMPVYKCRETINVFTTMETNLWQKNGTAPYLSTDSSGKTDFMVTEECLNSWSKNMTDIYVVPDSVTVSSENEGHSYFEPVNLTTAISKIVQICMSYEEINVYLIQNMSGTGGYSSSNNYAYFYLDLSSLSNQKKINIKGWGKSKVIVDAGSNSSSAGRVMYFTGKDGVAHEITLENLEIKGGYLTALGMQNGGGIFSKNVDLTLKNCTVSSNQCCYYYGGGVYVDSGSGSFTAVDTVFENNSVQNGTYGNGGAVYSFRPVTLTRCTFNENKATSSSLVNSSYTGNGGAVGVNSSTGTDTVKANLTVHNCTFTKNTSTYYGGAVCYRVPMGVSDGGTSAGFYIDDSSDYTHPTVFTENSGKYGSAAYLPVTVYGSVPLYLNSSNFSILSNQDFYLGGAGLLNLASGLNISGDFAFYITPLTYSTAVKYTDDDTYSSSYSKVGVTANGSSTWKLADTGYLEKLSGSDDESEKHEDFSSAASISTIDLTSLSSSSSFTGNYSISSESDLRAFATIVNSGASIAGATFVLTAAVNLTSPWTPAGTSAVQFNGNFNGNNYTISGFNIDASGTAGQGLIGYMNQGNVSNVKISGLMQCGEDSGAIIGCVTGSATISNCNMDVSITSSGANIGSVIGKIQSGSSVTVLNCINKGSITSSGSYLGGITGYAGGSASIINCANLGNISSSSSEKYESGILGFAASTASSIGVQNSYNKGTIQYGTSDMSAKAYGIIYMEGTNGGSISNCYYLSDSCSEGLYSASTSTYNSVISFNTSGTACTLTTALYSTYSDLVEALNNFVGSSTTYRTWEYDLKSGISYGMPVYTSQL